MTDTADRPSPAAASPDFPIEWLTPHDAELSWEWDDMHMPMSVAPLAGGLICGRWRRASPTATGASGSRSRSWSGYWNGYAYFTVDTEVPEADRDAMWARRDEAARAQIAAHRRVLARTGHPGAARPLRLGRGACRSRRCRADELAAAWDEAWARIGRGWVDPLLCDPRPVPGPRGPGRLVRIGRRRTPRRARRSA